MDTITRRWATPPSCGVWIALLVETKVSLFYWKENPGHLAFLRNGWVCGSGWGDPLVEGMETHSSILAWRIPWTEDPSGLQSTTQWLTMHAQWQCWLTKADPAGSGAAEGFQAHLSHPPDSVLGGSLEDSPAQSRLHQNPWDCQRRCRCHSLEETNTSSTDEHRSPIFKFEWKFGEAQGMWVKSIYRNWKVIN